MSKIQEVFNGHNWTRAELQAIVNEASTRLEAMKPLHLKKVFKRCGKENCTCSFGELEQYGHGPYLYAVYQDDNGRRRQKSLGNYHPRTWFEELREELEMPAWWQFKISDRQYQRLPERRQWDCHERTLSEDEFRSFYGLDPYQDGLGRPWRIRYDRQKLETAINRYNERRKVATNEFAQYGVGKHASVIWLENMLDGGYYVQAGAGVTQ